VVSLVDDNPVVLRPGGVTIAQLEQVLGCEIAIAPVVTQATKEDETPASPGMKYQHYAPKARLTLVRGTLEAFINAQCAMRNASLFELWAGRKPE
jgi:L-threonylcarbamoyladenylate synthase